MDFQQILIDLQKQAKTAAKEHDLAGKMKKGRDLGEAALEKLKTDRNTQVATAGAGALIAAMLLGTKGGRRFIGATAKTGAVAGLGALAYHAWMKSQGQKPDTKVEPAQLGYVTAKKAEPEFAEALVRTILAAAWSDGILDEAEKVVIDTALKDAGHGAKERAILENTRPEAETLDKIAAGALSPNHAAQLYAAACVVTGDPAAEEAGFLARLARRLGIGETHAAAIRAEAKG
ncbi:MAG: DUF533 domain-containing protein [Hyphomonas sp.]|uniref:DUF533 domain-containing protein n=1 Tax=Hyphomonas sp. TaxID=87 RepID=UPI0034A084F5